MSINKNIAVFTTKYILEDNFPILYVVRNEDGEWQFLGDQDVELKDIMIVPLNKIIDYDSTIGAILDLDYNMEATRNTVDDVWVIQKSTE